jgi:hypothetical protein
MVCGQRTSYQLCSEWLVADGPCRVVSCGAGAVFPIEREQSLVQLRRQKNAVITERVDRHRCAED